MMNGAYQYLDLVPNGRDEDENAGHKMSWYGCTTATEDDMNYRDSARALATVPGPDRRCAPQNA